MRYEARGAMFGDAVRRTEDDRLLRGAGRYVDDLRLPGTLALVIVRSLHAHARVLGVDTVAARAMHGVCGVFTLTDVPELRDALPPPVMNAMAIRPYRQSALVEERARYTGEPIAVVVAESPYAAADAAEQVSVSYDVLPAVTGVRHARGAGAPLVHPEWGTNVAGTIEMQTGDVERAFARSDLVITRRLTAGRMFGLPL